MGDFQLKKHSVKTASFVENPEKEKKNNMEIGVEGGISIPKNYKEDKHVIVQLKFHAGNSEERLYLTLETVSVFEIENEGADVSEEAVQKACLPIALMKLRNTVKMVTEAYGKPALDLPPFEQENTQE